MTLTQIIARSVDILPWAIRNRINSIPLVAAFQRWLVNRVMKDREFVHRISAGPAQGLIFSVRLPDDKLYWTGTWEHDIAEVIAKHMSPGLICYDIGSHRGFMAGVMVCNGAGTVFCFEPNPENVDRIETMMRLNPSKGLRLLPYAIGAANSTARFEIMSESSMGKLSTSGFQRGVAGERVIDVEVRKLDDLVASSELPPPGFIKIDIEGAELDALEGASNLVKTVRPTFLIEVHSFELCRGCAAWLSEHGYDVRLVQGPLETLTEENFRVSHLLAVPDR